MSAELRRFRTILIILIGLISLSCNDYSSVLPQPGLYKIAVYVDNTPLEMYGFVGLQKTFKPAFVTPVASDPDVQGLSISIRDLQNKIRSTEIVYSKTTIETTGTRIVVPNLDSTLPEFTIPEDLPIGPYKILLKILGTGGVLSEKEIPFYYMADAQLTIKDIHSFPPGYKPSVSAPLFPPNMYLLLEVSIQSDIRLDPYLIWYEGNRILLEGRLAEGADRLLWKTPEAEGFQTIRVELYPEKPDSNKSAGIIPNVSTSLRLAVSKTAPIPGIDFAADNYSLWYHFLGTLEAETAEGVNALSISKKSLSEIRWIPGDDSYGLAVGAAHQYIIDSPLLPPQDNQISAGSILLRFTPSVPDANGTVFFALFTNTNKIDEPLTLKLSMENGILKLKAGIGNESLQVPLISQKLEAKTFYNIEFEIKETEKALQFFTNKSAKPLLKIPLPENFSYSSSGIFGFGEPKTVAADTSTVAIIDPVSQDTAQNVLTPASPQTTVPPIIAIIDEFGIKF
ncbi:MAG TPA: hypothetical protein PLB48_10050 [Treponema sp.]|nr:hypothetical protein [Treponema sp.]